ncbi:MAG: MBOAT family protein [Chloroflexi bacterium]|nr:MBOAT family protein [Chloroflexota bacterium]
MDLIQILIFITISVLIGFLARGRWRSWAILGISSLALFWLQPASAIRHLDFWFPTLAMFLTALTWIAVRPRGQAISREDLYTFGGMTAIPILISLLRNLDRAFLITATRPPQPVGVLFAALLAGVILVILVRASKQNLLLTRLAVLLILGLFIVLKSDSLGQNLSRGLRSWTQQPAELASALDLSWLGFSYIAFRLLHTLRDAQTGKLPELSLRAFAGYVLFFPALTAGPIDRVERFQKDLGQAGRLSAEEAIAGGTRIVVGVFKKFVLADGLALIALNNSNAAQVQSSAWLWVITYAFSLRLYFDFSGYTDVAIGMAQIAGVRLPENFDRPYTRLNITAFWNSWHITLAQWFRTYFFNPLTRALRRGRIRPPAPVVIFVTQVSTMVLIGLWHGIAWNFLLWGLWHGVGLFIHNRWVNFQRANPDFLPRPLQKARAMNILSGLLTFHFVTLGWIWFVIRDVEQAWATFARLFGG